MIIKTWPLALIGLLLLAGCSTTPNEEELATAEAAGLQAAIAQQRLQERAKTRVFLDSYELQLLSLIREHGFEMERRDDLLSISIPVDDYFNIKRQANTLLPNALSRIGHLVHLLQGDPESSLLILGHQDTEQAEKNSKLSTQQAQAVAAIFRLAGFGRERLMFKGVGADRPRATNDSAEGRKLNRRVELLLTRQSTLHSVMRSYSELRANHS